MNKILQTLVLLIMYVAPLLYSGCDKCKDCGDGTFLYNASHCNLALTTPSANNSSIAVDEYSINARIFMSENRGLCVSTKNFTNYGNLYATSPQRPILDSLLDSITHVEIIDILGFNNATDSNLTNKFVASSSSLLFKDTLNASEMITRNFNELEEYYSSIDFQLKLNQNPSTEKWHQFILKIYLSDKRVLEQQTDSIFLTY